MINLSKIIFNKKDIELGYSLNSYATTNFVSKFYLIRNQGKINFKKQTWNFCLAI